MMPMVLKKVKQSRHLKLTITIPVLELLSKFFIEN